MTGRPDQAVVHYETSLKLDPENANTWNNLALLLATSSDPSVRNGPRAIELAQHAKQMTQNKNAVVLATLAAAYAEGGRFADAVKTVEAALELISSSPSNSLVQALQSQLDLYLRGIPYHERADMAVPSTSRKP